MDVAGVIGRSDEFEPAMSGELDFFCARNGSFIKDIIGSAIFASRIIGNHAKVWVTILGMVTTMTFGKEARCVVADVGVVSVSMVTIQGEGRKIDDFVGEAGMLNGRFVKNKTGKFWSGVFAVTLLGFVPWKFVKAREKDWGLL